MGRLRRKHPSTGHPAAGHPLATDSDSPAKRRFELQVDQGKVRRAIISVIVGVLITFVLALLAFGFRVGDALIAVLWILPLNLYFAYTYMRKKPESP
jgi:hypothetical protein